MAGVLILVGGEWKLDARGAGDGDRRGVHTKQAVPGTVG